MNRRDQDRVRRPHKRSRSPDDRPLPAREDKRRRPQPYESKRDRSPSPRATRSTRQNGRAERHDRRDERREQESRTTRSQGTLPPDTLTDLDVQHTYNRERRSSVNSKPEIDQKNFDRKSVTKPPAPKSSAAAPKSPTKAGPITAASLLDEDAPPLLKTLGFMKFSSTKGKKHDDYGGVDKGIKKRKYRQYITQPR